MAEGITDDNRGWAAHPVAAALVRAATLLLPIAASVAVVYAVSRQVPPPGGAVLPYLGWWLGLSAVATLALVTVGRLSRRLLPLAALLRVSLVFPDATPSRFRTAVAAGTVESLEDRLARARRGDATPTDAAQQLLALVAALDVHDGLTRGHSERVRAYAQLIGRELGLDRHELDLLNWAALLHDIGKLEIPSEVLNKTGRPTEEEWATIKRHPELGVALVAPLRPWLGPWADAVGDHHERWDGGGYPHGIAETDISLGGRIVAVADVFDVITSARSYKQASSMAAARAEIGRCAGAQFDPEVVRAFLAVSIGRARFATGPASWLAHAAVLARTPLTSAAGTLSAAAVVGVAAAPGGILLSGAQLSGPPDGTGRATASATAAVDKRLLPTAGGRDGIGGRARTSTPATPPAGARGGSTGARRADAGSDEPRAPAPVGRGTERAAAPTGAPDAPSAQSSPSPDGSPPDAPAPVVPLPDAPLPDVPLPDVPLPQVPLPNVAVPDPGSVLPDVPSLPDAGSVVPDVPQTPSVPTVPTVPDPGGLPSAPALPQAPAPPSTPTLPSPPKLP